MSDLKCLSCGAGLFKEEYTKESIKLGDVYACGYCYTDEFDATPATDFAPVRYVRTEINFRLRHAGLATETQDELKRLLRLLDDLKTELPK